MKLPDPSLPWPIPMEAVALIAEFEGCRLKAYKCPAGVWTIGWGETAGVTPGMEWTQEYADQRFCESLTEYAAKVRAMVTQPSTPEQIGALTSLAYNIGLEGLRRSTVLRQHNAGDFAAASRAFNLWNKARVNGVLTELPGLTRRRAAEQALYLKAEEAVQMPQAVDGESSLSASPINQSGIVTIVTGAVALAGSVLEPIKPLVKDLTEMAASFGVPPSTLVGVVLLIAGGTTVYWRVKQRRDGWS